MSNKYTKEEIENAEKILGITKKIEELSLKELEHARKLARPETMPDS